MSKAVKSCQKQSKAVKSSQKLSKVIKSYLKFYFLSHAVKSCHKLGGEEGGTVTLVNDRKVPTRIDPGTKKGSILDHSHYTMHQKVDTNRKMTSFAKMVANLLPFRNSVRDVLPCRHFK